MTEHFSYSQHVFSVSCPSCHVGVDEFPVFSEVVRKNGVNGVTWKVTVAAVTYLRHISNASNRWQNEVMTLPAFSATQKHIAS